MTFNIRNLTYVEMDFEESSEQLDADLDDRNIFSSPVLASKSESDVLWPGYKEELTTKRAIELLIAGTLKSKVCRYCLNIVSSLSELDQILQIAGTGVLHKVTIRDMVASFYPFKVSFLLVTYLINEMLKRINVSTDLVQLTVAHT